MSDVPSDLYLQILRRLPVESLFRFRSVCKEWRRIIDDHQFAEMHLGRPPIGSEYLFIRNSTGKLYSLPLASLDGDSQISTEEMMIKAVNIKNIVGGVPRLRKLPVASCDGLILIPAWNKFMVWLLWNPFTRESLALPFCDDFVNIKGGKMPCSGLGYDAVNNDYKAVRIAPCSDNFGLKFVTFIYSMNLNSWHSIRDLRTSFILEIEGTGVFRNGSLYWVAKELRHNLNPIANCMIALDLGTETFRKVPLPSEFSEYNRCNLQLTVLGGHLFLSCYYRALYYVAGTCFVLWMTTDDGSENRWIRILSLDCSNIWEGNIRAVAYLKNKEHVLLHVCNKEFWWWDVKNKCMSKVMISDLPDNFSSQVFPASLVRLKGSDPDYLEGIFSARTLKRKRNGVDDRLKLKIAFPFAVRSNSSIAG